MEKMRTFMKEFVNEIKMNFHNHQDKMKKLEYQIPQIYKDVVELKMTFKGKGKLLNDTVVPRQSYTIVVTRSGKDLTPQLFTYLTPHAQDRDIEVEDIAPNTIVAPK